MSSRLRKSSAGLSVEIAKRHPVVSMIRKLFTKIGHRGVDGAHGLYRSELDRNLVVIHLEFVLGSDRLTRELRDVPFILRVHTRSRI